MTLSALQSRKKLPFSFSLTYTYNLKYLSCLKESTLTPFDQCQSKTASCLSDEICSTKHHDFDLNWLLILGLTLELFVGV